MAPIERAMLAAGHRHGRTLPPEFRDVLERYPARPRAVRRCFVVGSVVGLMFWLFLGAIFSTIGGLLGASIFKKNAAARRHRHHRRLSRCAAIRRSCTLVQHSTRADCTN